MLQCGSGYNWIVFKIGLPYYLPSPEKNVVRHEENVLRLGSAGPGEAAHDIA